MTTSDQILGAAFAIIITAIFVSMSLTLYLSHRMIEHIESLLPNSKLINDNIKLYAGLGLPGKAARFGAISFMLIFPKAYARRGLIDIHEVNQLPDHIKKPLTRLVITCLALALALLAFGACLYAAENYKTI
ncbi:TPA: hypothetical protein U8203_003410 [Pseudomonas putida]|uniref:hypothetical protein n=1 Tax=Pseudomonas putida TaxID=303 RepID=UPI0020C4D6C3|nr:hypothetical protein [Pseudomonas putida]UTL80533.1 hypothetical protein NL778_21535 [Pseudomonas putida]HEN8712874.1 hypothetical protein [Pseudomonas putida]HEN8718072.1 hypothetical protein [Pseudomonas putida]